MKLKLTPAFIAKPPPPPFGRDRITFWEGSFGLMVTAGGAKSFVVQYRAAGKSRRLTLKKGLTLTEARREAKAILGAVARGGDPLGEKRKVAAAASTTLRAVAEEFLRREGGKMRTGAHYVRNLERLVYPVLGDRQITDIKRSEIVRLLDDVEDQNGPHMAQKVLGHLSRIFNWYAGRSDDFRSPIVRMARTKMQEGARDRILSDDELRAVWRAAEAFPAPYAPLVRFLLLTATRRSEAARMAWGELSGGDWIIPALRMKGGREHVVPLSGAARAILDGLPKIGVHPFTASGRKPTRNFAKYKIAFDAACGVADWRLHDLRRTARSLMSRAGVAPDIAERCLAHVIGGVRGVYDRHAYYEEKKKAFEALAALVGRIVDPIDNVVELQSSGTK
jgi:integrase